MDLEKKLKDHYKNIKENTMKTYIYNFKRLVKMCDIEDGEYDSDNTINKVIKYCKEQTNGMCNSLLNSYLKCLKVLTETVNEDIEKKIMNIIKENYNNSLVLSEANEKEKNNYIKIEDIIKIREKHKNNLTDDFKKEDIYYVLLCLYTMLPPLRSQDYYNSYLYEDSTKEDELNNKNYLCLKKKQLIINDSKTSKHYGTKIIDLSEELIQILNNFKNKSKSKYVLCSIKGNKILSNNFPRLFNEALEGKKISSSMMRKTYVSDNVIDKNIDVDKRKEISKIMGHSINTQINTYSKFSKTMHYDPNDLNSLLEAKKVLQNQIEDIDKHIVELCKKSIIESDSI